MIGLQAERLESTGPAETGRMHDMRAETKVDAPVMIAIPGGRFWMGRGDQRPDEAPAHEVVVAGFLAARTPVLNREYARFVAATGVERPEFASEERFAHADRPAVGISWHDAVAYCRWLSDTTGKRYRLPTEAEREWAALGGRDGADWAWAGSMEAHPAFAAIAGLNEPHAPTEACANGYGLLCMAENVHEWCADWYAKDWYERSPASRPSGPQEGKRRVSRGGSWRHSTKFTRVTARASLDPSFRYNDFGFRVYADGE